MEQHIPHNTSYKRGPPPAITPLDLPDLFIVDRDFREAFMNVPISMDIRLHMLFVEKKGDIQQGTAK